MSKILHIIHPQFNFFTINKNSILLDNINVDLSHNEYHTSLGDLTVREILSVVPNFDSVNFCKNTFVKYNDSLYKETVTLLHFIQNSKPVLNLEVSDPISFVDDSETLRRSDKPVLWVFGCSHSYGVGLRKGEQRYGDILSEDLGLPLKLIAKPGSSLHWSLRHLINADLRPSDTVIWQITTPPRVSVFNGKHVEEVVLARTNNKHLLEVFSDEQIYFNHLTLLMFGVRYLRAKNINFRLTSFEDRPGAEFRIEYAKYPEYCYAPGFNVDVGTDGQHYGPLSHKRLAKHLLDHIQCKDVYTI